MVEPISLSISLQKKSYTVEGSERERLLHFRNDKAERGKNGTECVNTIPQIREDRGYFLRED